MNKMYVIVFFLAVGCTTSVPLSRGGSKIRIVPEAHVSQTCSYVGTFSAEYGGNFLSYEDNLRLAENEIRNDAAARGATHVVLKSAARDRDQQNFAAAVGGTGGCENCAHVQGQGYKCK